MSFLDDTGVSELVADIKTKADATYNGKLISGVNIKTINSASILGNGNITVPTGSTATPLMDGTATAGSSTAYAKGDHRHPTDTGRQAKLVSGTNIKTINSTSLLGSGDIAIAGLPSVSSADNGKVLRVVSGAWAAVQLPSASGVNF